MGKDVSFWTLFFGSSDTVEASDNTDRGHADRNDWEDDSNDSDDEDDE